MTDIAALIERLRHPVPGNCFGVMAEAAAALRMQEESLVIHAREIQVLFKRIREVEAERDRLKCDCDEWKARFGAEARLVDSAVRERDAIRAMTFKDCEPIVDAIERKTIEECAHLAEVMSGDIDVTGESAAAVATAYQIAARIRALAEPKSEG